MLKEKTLNQLSRKMVAEPDNYMSSLRKNLLTYVSEREITMAEIAEAANISIDTLKTVIYGDSKDVKLSTIVAIAKALHISIDELVGAGTISPVMCEFIQITRNLPENFVYFVRWAIRYHERQLTSKKASKKAINVMMAECTHHGNLRMNNNFELMDISNLDDVVRPKIYMGLQIPCDHYMPIYSEGDVLLLANDRLPLQTEVCLIVQCGFIWMVKRKVELDENGKKVVNYYNARDGKFRSGEDQVDEILGYVVRTVPNTHATVDWN